MSKKNEKKEKKNNGFFIFTIIILFLALLFVLAKYYYPIGLKIKEYPVINKKINKDINGLKIIHISDIHYKTTVSNNDLTRISKEVNKYKPDIIVFTGDLFSKEIKYNNDDIEILKEFLTSMDANIAKYAISGEEDVDQNYESLLSDSGFKSLNNSSDLIYANISTPIFISGIDTNNPDYNKYKENNDDNIYSILLLHKPDYIKKLDLNKIDLILAGHSHGGQIRLPFIGPIYNFKDSKIYYNDYYKVDSTDIFISSGIGTSKYYYRFLNKPSINLYRLYYN